MIDKNYYFLCFLYISQFFFLICGCREGNWRREELEQKSMESGKKADDSYEIFINFKNKWTKDRRHIQDFMDFNF